jgi:predicted amino acid-binding ACT domain protein
MAPSPAAPRGSDAFVLTITGPDQKGIIRKITSFLAARSVNIADLWATASGGQFMLTAQLEVPPDCELQSLSLDIESLWPGHGMRVTIQHENIFLATNNVDFRHEAR